uniref:ABC transporter Scarlet n=1 Tax=Thermobia domestica TaxID=89055 RepID=A0A2Z5ZBK5_THEDO|nr:ABC transporter Scarlet [Thermobia domestica]
MGVGLEGTDGYGESAGVLLQQSLSTSYDACQEEFPIIPLPVKSPKNYDWSPSSDGITLTWRDLSVYVPQRSTSLFKKRNRPFKRILNSVTGAVKPGSLVAMMGASGAGKTTLMRTLAHRNPRDVVVDGDIRVNGIPVGDFMNTISGYVYQEDLFISTMTVREHLNFMAWLKLDRRIGTAERNRHVIELLYYLGLMKCADTTIGEIGENKALSGGEKKRLAFATEILTDPPLLFCDEPTTGLDSFSAQKIVHMMKYMASKGKTVVCTIHQPSSELFALFHELVLLADGRIAYIGSTEGALQFFNSLGYDCPRNYNPADFFIHMLAVTPGDEANSRNTIKRICDNFAVTDHAKAVEVLVHYEMHIGSSGIVRKDLMFQRKNVQVFWITQLYWLTNRSFKQVLRDPSVQALRIIQKMVIALIAGLCYVGTTLNQEGIQSIQGALFIFVTENTFSPMYSVLNTFPEEKALFTRERSSGLYGTGAYYLSKVFAMLPGLILEPFLFVVIAYWLVGLKEAAQAFFLTAVIVILTMNISTACGYFFSASFESVPIALSYLVPFDYVLMATSGLFVKLSTLPLTIGWMQYLSWLMYANEALSIVQWNGIHNITCEYTSNLPCVKEGEAVLEAYSFSETHFTRDIVAMCSLYIIFHILGFISLYLRSKNT